MATQEYPKYLFHRTSKPVLVKDQAEHAALPPGWHESPADVNTIVEPTAANTVAPVAPVAPPAPVAPVDPPATPAASDEKVSSATSFAESLYAANVATVIEKLAGASEPTLLQVQALEAANPKGARKGVMTAIEAKLKALAPAAV